MNLNGRIAACGAITGYTSTGPVKASIVQPAVVAKVTNYLKSLKVSYSVCFQYERFFSVHF